MGLFLAIVIIPSQWPRFFNKERSEKLAAALSDVNSTWQRIKKSTSSNKQKIIRLQTKSNSWSEWRQNFRTLSSELQSHYRDTWTAFTSRQHPANLHCNDCNIPFFKRIKTRGLHFPRPYCLRCWDCYNYSHSQVKLVLPLNTASQTWRLQFNLPGKPFHCHVKT